MAASSENNSASCDGVYGSLALDRHDPFDCEGNGTAKFIGTGISKFDFHTIKASNAANSKRSSSRPELTRNELLHMLCCLEGELQARDVVIAALRNDRVKQYIHALRSKNLTLDDPAAALFRDKAAIAGNHVSRQSSTTAIQADIEVRAIIEQQMESLCHIVTKQRHTQVRMVNVLSDSLENNQRMRQELEEEKRKHEHDTAQGDDITYGLEMERTKLKQELDAERLGRKKLEKDLKKAQEALEFERSRQKQIVLLLLAERKKIIMKYIEERKRSEDLAQILSEEKQRSDSIAEGLEEESKKSLRMEADMEKQALVYETERKAWKQGMAADEKRFKDMELELAQLRTENETFRKQMALRMAVNQTASVGSKVRTVPDDVTTAVASSSIINVAKIVQPTATVSSVPVSGPTTGIARSISPGQCLRQQAMAATSDMIGASSGIGGGGGTTMSSNQTVAGAAIFNPATAKVNNANTTTTTTPRKLSNSTPISLQQQHSSTLGGAGGIIIDALSSSSLPSNKSQQLGGGGANNNNNQSTILRSGNVASTISTAVPLLIGSQSAVAAAVGSIQASCSGRGMPPPIPPNKPIVPPKREPSLSRIGSGGGGPSMTNPVPAAVVGATTPTAASTSNHQQAPITPPPPVAVLANQISSNPLPSTVSNS